MNRTSGAISGGTTVGGTGSELIFKGRNWGTVKRRLSNHYAQLTGEDLDYVPGAEEALFGRIMARTLETRKNLEQYLREECGCTW